MTLFREMGQRFAPACSHCLTAIWMAYDGLWDFFVCRVCGEWEEPYWRVDQAAQAPSADKERP